MSRLERLGSLLDGQGKFFQYPCNDPHFLPHIYSSLIDAQEEKFLFQLFDLRAEGELSALFDRSGLQEGFRFRALWRARRLAAILIDAAGEVNLQALERVLSSLENEGNIFYPYAFNESYLLEHFLSVLKEWSTPEVLQIIRRFRAPVANQWAEKLVLETLGEEIPLSDAALRRAVLIAALTPLRQNVGSCFATAPAILIQREQHSLFLSDLSQLLSTGKLTRIFGGVEYSVPLSPSAGMGDLKKSLIPLSSKNLPWFSPGLIAALEVILPFPKELSMEQKGEMAAAIVRSVAEGKKTFTVEECIRELLLRQIGVTQEELDHARRLEITRIKRGQLVFGRGEGQASKKLEKWQQFSTLQTKARAAFNGICDCALLKAWEFTLASYSEVKMEFSRWNLYSSLGLSSQESGGVGEVIVRHIDARLEKINEKIEEYQREYAIAFDQLKLTESLLRKAAGESDARRLQAEYQSRSHHMRSCQEMRDKVHFQGSQIAQFYPFLIKQYDEKFPEYFQEIYDAEMQDFQGEIYDDCPAGFRLVYKHGRSDPALWSLIYDGDQYIDALVEFFISSESQIASGCDWEGGAEEVAAVTSLIVSHLRTERFLETALHRMAKAHQAPLVKSPLSNLHAIDKKPWAYTSGGAMTTLVKTYYSRENDIPQEGKWVESESELLIFFIDVLKNLSHKIMDPFLKNPRKGMLASSPTHAFYLLPGDEVFRRGWQEEIFTYTWVRDEVFLPSQKFYADLRLDAQQQEFLVEEFCGELPFALAHAIRQGHSSSAKKLTVIEWRNRLIALVQKIAGASRDLRVDSFADLLDSFLYQSLPIIPGREWKAALRRLFSDLNSPELEETLQLFPEAPCALLTARAVKEMAKGCYLLSTRSLFSSFDLSSYIAKHSRYMGLSAPTPLLFADTNWTNYFFGFVVNPGTGRLELWRLDRTLSSGTPMNEWKQWLNGTDRKQWCVYW